MVEAILRHKKAFKKIEFDTKNYSSIKSSGLKNMVLYIDNNINTYIDSVYLKLDSNVKESPQQLVELLNNDEITIENKRKIIKNSETIIGDIREINELEVVNLLLHKSKMLAGWQNIISIFIDNDNT